MIGLNVDPGACCAWMARFSSGLYGFGRDLRPVGGLDPARKNVRIESRDGSPSPALRRSADPARLRRRACPALPVRPPPANPGRESTGDLLPGIGFLQPDDLALPAQVIHQHLALAVHADQAVVVLALQPGLADDVALAVLGEIRRIQFLLADLADVADDVRRQSIPRIQPALGAESVPSPGNVAGSRWESTKARSARVSSCLMMTGSYLGRVANRLTRATSSSYSMFRPSAIGFRCSGLSTCRFRISE